MFVPERRRLKANLTPCRQACEVDVPTLELSPIIDRWFVVNELDRRVRSDLATQCAQCRSRRQCTHALLRMVWAANDTVSKLALVEAEDRSRRYLKQACERQPPLLRHTGSVYHQCVQHCRMRWKCCNPLAHLLQREIVEPLDVHAIREFCELSAAFA